MGSRLKPVFLVASAFLVACASPPPAGLAPGTHVQDPGYLGSWQGQGRTVAISGGPGDSFVLKVSEGAETETFRGYLLDIDARRVCEISVADRGGGDKVPVFHYGLVDRRGDTLTHTPLRPEWLQQAIAATPGATYVETSRVAPGSGGAVVGDRASMRALLGKAIADPAAWGTPETLTRAR